MEIAVLWENSVKIKGKQGVLAVNPFGLRAKTTADAIVLFDKANGNDFSKIEGSRVLIEGPGEYEVLGIKISGFPADGGTAYSMNIDGVLLLLAKTQAVEKLKEKVDGHQVVCLLTDQPFDQGAITAASPQVVVFFGEKRADMAKTLGKGIKTAAKYTTTPEKLPAEMEVILLG